VKKFKKIFAALTIFYFSLLLVSFSVPLYRKIAPVAIMLFFLAWCAYIIAERKKIHFKFNYTSLFSVLLYAVIAISLLYTTDIKAGLFDLEVKFSLLFFPVLMSFTNDFISEKKRFNNVLSAFVLGTFTITIVCLIIAFYRCFTIFFTVDFFTYTYLASFHHPTYFAMFINLSVTVLLSRLIERWRELNLKKKTGISVLIIYFISFILMLNSKAGILVLFLNFIGIIFYYTLIRKKIYVFVLLIAAVSACSFLVVRMVPFVNYRFQEMSSSLNNIKAINKNPDNDSEQRLLIWKYSLQIISDTWPTGVGAGDVRPSLNKTYLDNGFARGFEKNLNCHNQFLQIFVSTGIIGFLLLILLLGSMLIISIKNRNIVLFSFFIIITGNMLTESILETQAGTVFFGFFVAFLVNFQSGFIGKVHRSECSPQK